MTSWKKSIAALAASLPLAAFGQQAAAPAPLYQIYGTLNVNGQYVEISRPAFGRGTNVTGRTNISTDSTNLGIKGTLDTGAFGLGVVYQCESNAPVNGIQSNGFCLRNSRLGLTSAFGTLFYGNWDTPYKGAWYGTKADDAFGNTDVYDAAALMSSPGFKTKGTAGGTASAASITAGQTTYEVRAADSIAYHSPKFMGLSAKVQYSTNTYATDNGKISPALYSAAVNYDQGPLSVFAAYERHDDWFGIQPMTAAAHAAVPAVPAFAEHSTVDYGIKAGAGYELGSPFGTTTLGAAWELLNYGYAHTKDLPTGALKSFERQAMMVNLKHRTGNHELRARYEYADAGKCKIVGGTECSTAGFGAQNYALGYAYYLASSTQLYVYWTKINNARNATYTFATAGTPQLNAASWSAGADPMALGLGMRYAF